MKRLQTLTGNYAEQWCTLRCPHCPYQAVSTVLLSISRASLYFSSPSEHFEHLVQLALCRQTEALLGTHFCNIFPLRAAFSKTERTGIMVFQLAVESSGNMRNGNCCFRFDNSNTFDEGNESLFTTTDLISGQMHCGAPSEYQLLSSVLKSS